MPPQVLSTMHPQLERLYAEGTMEAPDGTRVRVTSHIPRDEADLLYRVVARADVGDAVEVGMAFGVSTLALADALAQRSDRGSLVVMDPAQRDATWRGLGLAQIEAAGLGGRVEFHERPSQAVLPELWQAGRRFQVAFVDGWHTFDHALVDCFYADLMLEVGGYLVLDDVGYPAIRRMTQFLLANRAYVLEEALHAPGEREHHRVRRVLKRWLGALARTDATPGAPHRALFRRLIGTHAVALRKVRHDDRRFDHFVPF